MLLLMLAQGAIACERDVPVSEFVSTLLAAQNDPSAATLAKAALPCLTEPITAADAALFHRVMAADSTRRGRDTEALASARSAVIANPAWLAPASLAALYARARAAPEESPIPLGVETRVDGQVGMGLHADRPAIVQTPANGGMVTRYIVPGVAAPAVAAPLAALAASSGETFVPLALPNPAPGAAADPTSPLAAAPGAEAPTLAEAHMRPEPGAAPLLGPSLAVAAGAPTRAVVGDADRNKANPVPYFWAAGGALAVAGIAAALSVAWSNQFFDLDNAEIERHEDLTLLANGANGAAFVALGAGIAGGSLAGVGVLVVVLP